MQRRAVLAGLASAAVSTPARAQTPMADETTRNLATVRRFFDRVYGARDPDGIDGTVSPDYVPSESTYAPGVEAYRARLADYFAKLDRDYASYAFVWDDAISADDVVCIRFRITAATRDGMKAERQYANWFELRDGLITTYI